MKKLIIYLVILVLTFAACEDIYTPDIDDVGNVIVADARIVKGSSTNFIKLTQSQGFNDDFTTYPPIAGASVKLIDNAGNDYDLTEATDGNFYVHVELEEDREYKITIDFDGNGFESEYEKVPPIPRLDTVYGIPETKTVEVAGSNDVDDIRKVDGVQLYADIAINSEIPNYRFTASNVKEYTWHESTDFYDIMHFFWQTYPAGGIYNIAAPPEYSSSIDIFKHPLYFFSQSVSLEEDHYLTGFIMVLYQHAISGSSYNYYKDLNAQLDAEGRIFDPVYVQARSNIKCTTGTEKVILGNFEISNVVEHRYFVKYVSEEFGYRVEEVLDRSHIPWRGETIDVPPDFWVH